LNAIAAGRIVALILLFAVCAPLHIITKALFGRSRWPRRFLARAAWLCGARVRTTGGPIAPRTLLVCNHTSWLDIPILAGATGCAFVSKAELGHPLICWMADQNHTLYVQREKRGEAARQAEAVARKLEEPQPLTIFPEGTTGPGTRLLSFRSSLFEAVAPSPPGVTVRPVAIDYGEAAPEIGWYDEPGKNNVLRILGRSRPIPIIVRILDPLPPMNDRKALAAAAHRAIADALSSSPGTAHL
jgi:lyso-ornithine lipid O-acyltransferase